MPHFRNIDYRQVRFVLSEEQIFVCSFFLLQIWFYGKLTPNFIRKYAEQKQTDQQNFIVGSLSVLNTLYSHKNKNTSLHTCNAMYVCAYTQTHTLAYKITSFHLHIHMHTYTHTHAHVYIHTQICVYIHTYIYIFCYLPSGAIYFAAMPLKKNNSKTKLNFKFLKQFRQQQTQYKHDQVFFLNSAN